MTGTACDLCGRPSGDDAYICTPCAETLAAALRQVRGLAVDLDITLARQGTRPTNAETKRTKAASTTIAPEEITLARALAMGGVDPRASEARDILRNTLSTWVRTIHGDDGGQLPADTLPAMATWLAARCGLLRHLPYAGEAVDETLAAVRQALCVVDIPAVQEYVGPCECGAEVYARPGTPVARCRECGAEWDVTQQREWMRDAAEDQLMTAAEIARATSRPSSPVAASTVRSWAARGRIVSHGADERQRPLYRLGDALDLLARMSNGRIAS